MPHCSTGVGHQGHRHTAATLYLARKNEEAWSAERLTPMLAGLLELLPWLKQWHNEPSEEHYGERLGDYFEGFLEGECAALGLTAEDLRSWRPPKRGRGR